MLDNGEMPLPAVVLVVSGGHTSLYLVRTPGSYELLGRTRDDAAGEAYDKVAKLLGLGISRRAGRSIALLAKATTARCSFPKTRLTHADRNAPELPGRRDFSFSGLKTSVLRYVTARREALGLGETSPLPDREIRDICASFQRVVVETLLDRLFEAARWYGARSVGIAGGVSANSRLRAEARARGEARELPVFIPSLALSTDNAAMIARGRFAGLSRRHHCRLGSQRRCSIEALMFRDPSSAFQVRDLEASCEVMKTSTDYLWFNTKKRQEFIRITDEVAAVVKKSGVKEGMVLVSAMHITAAVYVNDWESGLIDDFQVWLEKLAPAGLDYRHHQTGEDNADAHLKRTLMGHQVILPITAGKLDLGPWEQVFYAEFDGQRKKRVVVKVMGE